MAHDPELRRSPADAGPGVIADLLYRIDKQRWRGLSRSPEGGSGVAQQPGRALDGYGCAGAMGTAMVGTSGLPNPTTR